VKNLENTINRAENGNPTLPKFIRILLYEDNSNIYLCDKYQELLDKVKLTDYIEMEKSKSPTLPSNPSGLSTNHKKPA
jgi:hypothetical protein